MNDFKVGDRVEYVGSNLKIKQLGALTVAGDSGWGGRLDVKEADWAAIHPDNLRHITPDVLTIPRAELPEVVEERGVMVAGGRDFGTFLNAAQHRKAALAQLAASEFLAAREKAEQEAADQHAAILNKRRDELVKEFCGMDVEYADLHDSTKALINYAIQLEGQVKK